MINPQNTASKIVNISGSPLALAEAVLAEPSPTPDLPDAETVRALAIVTNNPKEAAQTYGETSYDERTKAHRALVESFRDLLQREHGRLTDMYERTNNALDETTRNHIGYMKARDWTLRELLKLVIAILCLLSILGASIATITALLLDTGAVQSLPQAIALGLVPTATAFVLADHVGGIREQSKFRRWRTVINLFALLLVVPWITLLVLTFGTGATSGVEDLISQISLDGTDLPSSDSSALGYAFFIVAIFLEVLAGSSFKISIDQLLAGVERPVPDPNALYTEREVKLEAINAEQIAVRTADAALAGRIEEIDQRRVAFAAKVVALLMEPPSGGSTGHHHPKPSNPPTPPMPGHVEITHNGRIAS